MQNDTPAPHGAHPAADAAVAPEPDLRHELLALAESVRDLSRSQQSLLDTLARRSHPLVAPAPANVSGDPVGGGSGLAKPAFASPAKLSSVQQIALGLRDATPQGPRALASRTRASAGAVDEPETAPAGAD